MGLVTNIKWNQNQTTKRWIPVQEAIATQDKVKSK